MLAQTLQISGLTKRIDDHLQVSTDVTPLSKSFWGCRSGVQLPKYIQELRTAFVHLEIESAKLIEAFPDFGARVSRTAQMMKQPTDVKLESENGSSALFTWSALLRLRDFLEKVIHSRLRQATTGSTPCSAWLSTSAKSQFQACTALVEDELARVLPASMNAGDVERVQSVFNSVLQFQLALLDSAYVRNQAGLEVASPWHPSNIIFTTDFDATCTLVDSCEMLVRAAEAARSGGALTPGKLMAQYEATLYRHSERTVKALHGLATARQQQRKVAAAPTSDWNGSADLLPGMDPLLRPLLDDTVDASKAGNHECGGGGTYDDAGLRQALLKLAELEVVCNQEVMSSGVLRGSTRQEILEEAKRVKLRPDCPQVLQALAAIGTAIHVVSANWSRDLILGGLPDLPKDKVFAHCNDLSFDESGTSTGMFDLTMVDAFDKERMLQTLRRLCSRDPSTIVDSKSKAAPEAHSRARKMMVYMGDSHTDLLGLLEADLGIVIDDSAVTRTVMSLYGIQLAPLAEATAHIAQARLHGSQRSWRRSGILFEARGWADVRACLFGAATAERSVDGNEDVAVEQPPLQRPRFDANDVGQDPLPPVNRDFIQVVC